MRTPRATPFLFAIVALAFLFVSSTKAVAQYVVDCTGNTPGAYTTINSVIPLLSEGAAVRITGPCTENVTIAGLDNLRIGAPLGQTAVLNGNLSIRGVRDLFVHGINVTNPNGDGIDISNSLGVQLDDCSSSNNGRQGLNVSDSVVDIQNTGGFNNNGNTGIVASGITKLAFNGSSGPITVNGNLGDGISLQDGVMNSLGNLVVSNNKLNPNLDPSTDSSGLGIVFWGHARGVVYGLFATNVISGNQSGGIAVHEGSEISVSGPAQPPAGATQTAVIDNNGPVGISVGQGSQATIWNGVQITNHSDAGVDVYGGSEVFISGNDQIANNGNGASASYPTRAGVRVDGDSEAYIRGGQITENGGPGILALGNSSIDLSGATLTSNIGGSIVCDSSAWLVTNQTTLFAPIGFAFPCREPNTFGPSFRALSAPAVPHINDSQSDEAKYQQIMSSF